MGNNFVCLAYFCLILNLVVKWFILFFLYYSKYDLCIFDLL